MSVSTEYHENPAQDPSLKAVYASRATALLAHVPRADDAFLLTSTPPTTTPSAAGAATSITGGILRPPKRATLTAGGDPNIDMVNDPCYRYLGIALTPGVMVYGTLYPDYNYVRPVYLTGGASQSARWRVGISSTYTGQKLEWSFKALATTMTYRMIVNGRWVSRDPQTLTGLTAGSLYLLLIDFGSAAERDIVIESEDMNFGGYYIEPTASLSKGPRAHRKYAAFGDSVTGGASGISSLMTHPSETARLLGCDEWANLGIGGTGYLNGSTNGADFRSRLPDIINYAPDVLLVFGGYNDAAGNSQAAIQAEATYFLGQIGTNLPNCMVFVAGCWSPGTPSGVTLQATNAAVKAAAAAVGYPFIDLFDPLGVATTAPAWTASTVYRPGDLVLYGGVVYSCWVGHTSTGAFDITKWRATSWVNGTGYASAPTGDGNADVLIGGSAGTDTIHPTLLGTRMLGRRFRNAILSYLRDAAGAN